MDRIKHQLKYRSTHWPERGIERPLFYFRSRGTAGNGAQSVLYSVSGHVYSWTSGATISVSGFRLAPNQAMFAAAAIVATPFPFPVQKASVAQFCFRFPVRQQAQISCACAEQGCICLCANLEEQAGECVSPSGFPPLLKLSSHPQGWAQGFLSGSWGLSCPATQEPATVERIVQCRVEHGFCARLAVYACEVSHGRQRGSSAALTNSD